MDLVTPISRTPVTIRMAWIVASLLFGLGSWLMGQGAWIHGKALAAQWLLQDAWQETLRTQQPVKPWPWADTWPVGRLIVPRLSINQIILANASGQSLAFGPGQVENGIFSDDDSQGLLLSGHRDTHFSFVRDIQLGERITVQTRQGIWKSFVVEHIDVIDSRTHPLPTNQGRANLRLITCYPFDAVLPGGPLRYVVTARRVVPRVVSQAVAQARPEGGSRGRGMMGGVSWEFR
ncbi:MAG: class GN sortase [Nitrospirales bacterium]